MSLSIGIVGLPNVGKSTLFNALTKSDILAANYPFATIEPNSGIVPVPDERLISLQKIYSSQKVIPATVEFVDIAGLVAGASKGEGLGNQFLANIRQTNAILHVVRAFADTNVLRHDEAIEASPKEDIEVINTELILADLQTIAGRLPKLQKEARAKPELKPIVEALESYQAQLETGTPLNMVTNFDPAIVADLHLLTAKPVIYLFNVDESTLITRASQSELSALVSPNQSLFISAQIEEELKDLPTEDADELLASYGVEQSGLIQLAQAAYQTLGLQSYLTAGPKEVRAWTIPKGATAPQAAGAIHTDFERGFIAAQIVNYNDLISAGSESAAKAAGKIRTEGKNYIMQPDDVVEFRFNV